MLASVLSHLSLGLMAGALLGSAPAQPQSSPPAEAQDSTEATPQTTPKTTSKTTSRTGSPVASSMTMPAPATPSSFEPPAVSVDSAEVLVSTLPCGLRVLVAQDPSLPVAAVVLSIPSGTSDDPSRNPGLIHALAYALQMGNRELSPGAALDEVYDSGGFAEMAVGAGQTRFEALIPQWGLPGVLRVEADRFGTPTLSQHMWVKSLQYAAQDRRPPHAPHRPLRALAFEQPSLLNDGRVVLPALGEIPLPALSQYLTQHFRYDRASLAVVSANPPKQTLALVSKVFAKLRPATRVPAKAPPMISARPRPSTSTDNKGWLLRALAADPATQFLAQVLCEHIKRRGPHQAQGPDLPALHCEYHGSATHPFLQILLAEGDSDGTLLRNRLEHLNTGTQDAALLNTATRVMAQAQAQRSGALPMARFLASLPEWTPGGAPGQAQGYQRDTLAGQPASSSMIESGATLRTHLQRVGLLSPETYRVARPAPPPAQKPKAPAKPAEAQKPAKSIRPGKPAK